METWLPICQRGVPGVVKRAGMAMTAVNSGMKSSTRLRKKENDILDKKTRTSAIANRTASNDQAAQQPGRDDQK